MGKGLESHRLQRSSVPGILCSHLSPLTPGVEVAGTRTASPSLRLTLNHVAPSTVTFCFIVGQSWGIGR